MVEVILCGFAIWLVRKFTRYHLGIMLGFGVSATAQFLAFIGQFFDFGPMFKEAVIYAPLSAYIAASGTWLFAFLSKPKLNTQLDPVDVLAWLNEQERIAREISAGLGLKWPGKKGSARELVELSILGCFLESYEFGSSHGHALGFEQQVMQILVTASTS